MSWPVQLSYIRFHTRNAKYIESVELIHDGVRHHIPQLDKQMFQKAFDEPLMFVTVQLSLTRKPRFFREGGSEIITINSSEVLSSSDDREFRKWWGKELIVLGYSSKTASAGAISLHTRADPLQPSIEEFIKICPRFRILVVGQPGVGKSSLINSVFGVDVSCIAYFRQLMNIEEELTMPQNDLFVWHDSRFFEPADGCSYGSVKAFIEKRRRMPLIKDHVHAVWLCFQIPIQEQGERLLEEGTKEFLKEGKVAFSNTPIVVVFTKYDRLITHMRVRGEKDPQTEAKLYLQIHCIQPLFDFMGNGDVPYVAVTSTPGRERGLEELINLTYDKVSQGFAGQSNTFSPVSFVAAGAQRVVPELKIQSSIFVGKHRYWRTLAGSTDFTGRSISQCLRVIHSDIVWAWNICDPNRCLPCREFRELMINMVGDAFRETTSSLTNLTGRDAISKSSISYPTAVVVQLPFDAGLALTPWARETYQPLPSVHQKFMAYIVDLTHVLEILFATKLERQGVQLTRTAVKLAFNAYYESEWMKNVHKEIRDVEVSDMDYIDKTVSMIPLKGTLPNVIEAVRRVPPIDPDKDEEWHVRR